MAPTSSATDAAPRLPSIALARELGIALPDGEPYETRHLAALSVAVRLLRRSSWSEQKWLPNGEVARLAAAPPDTGVPGALYHVVGRTLATRGTLTRCLVHHYADEVVAWRELYLPSAVREDPAMRHFEQALLVFAEGAPPESQRCTDLAPRDVGAAYRTRNVARPQAFHGFVYDDALERAAAAVGAVFEHGTVLGGEVNVHAWPLLWLRYGADVPEPDVALVFDSRGELHAVGGVLD